MKWEVVVEETKGGERRPTEKMIFLSVKEERKT
jgi:hypothetical protein